MFSFREYTIVGHDLFRQVLALLLFSVSCHSLNLVVRHCLVSEFHIVFSVIISRRADLPRMTCGWLGQLLFVSSTMNCTVAGRFASESLQTPEVAIKATSNAFRIFISSYYRRIIEDRGSENILQRM